MQTTVTYDDVNGAWGGIKLPPITQAEAIPLFGKLIKKFGRHPDKLPTRTYWARKGRRVWASPKERDTSVYANGGHNGLGRMIHDASHIVFEDHHPGLKTHSHVHATLELEMIRYAMRKGWHLPKAKPEPEPKPGK